MSRAEHELRLHVNPGSVNPRSPLPALPLRVLGVQNSAARTPSRVWTPIQQGLCPRILFSPLSRTGNGRGHAATLFLSALVCGTMFSSWLVAIVEYIMLHAGHHSAFFLHPNPHQVMWTVIHKGGQHIFEHRSVCVMVWLIFWVDHAASLVDPIHHSASPPPPLALPSPAPLSPPSGPQGPEIVRKGRV